MNPEELRIHTDFGRFYNCDGQYYPSVTTFLSKVLDHSGLDDWRLRVGDAEANKITKQSTDRGTELHTMIEHYLKGEEYKPKYPYVAMMFKTIKKYLDRITNVRHQEYPLFSHKIRLAGTLDCAGDFDGIPSIIDFKNSNSIKSKQDILSYFIQTTLYAIMYKEKFNIDCKQLVIIMATEKNVPLLFVESPMSYIKPTLELIKKFNKEYNEFLKSPILNRN